MWNTSSLGLHNSFLGLHVVWLATPCLKAELSKLHSGRVGLEWNSAPLLTGTVTSCSFQQHGMVRPQPTRHTNLCHELRNPFADLLKRPTGRRCACVCMFMPRPTWLEGRAVSCWQKGAQNGRIYHIAWQSRSSDTGLQ